MTLKKKQYVLLTLVLIPGLLLVLSLYSIVNNKKDELALLKFEQYSSDIQLLIEREIKTNIEVLTALRAFYETTDAVSVEQFEQFTAPFLEQVKSIQVLAWIPVVTPETRAASEAYFHRKGFPKFRIKELNAAKEMEPSGLREVYHPVYYISPREGNEKAWGFNLSSNPNRKAALEKAKDLNIKTVTARITLVQETASQVGIIVFNPVFKDGEHLGFVDAAYRVGDLINKAILEYTEQSIDIRIYEEDSMSEESLIFHRASGESDHVEAHAGDPDFFKKTAIRFADKNWYLVCTPSSEFHKSLPNSNALIILALGLISLALVVTFLAFLLNNLNKKEAVGIKLQKALQKEKELNELKSGFVTLASHEFRTPLSTILSSAALISRYGTSETQEKRMRHVRKIKNAVNNLTTILDDFLSLGKIEEGRISVNFALFDLVELARKTMGEIKLDSKFEQEIIFSSSEESMPIRSDQNLLKNSILNLLSNACKYSPMDSKVELSISQKGNHVLIAVKDQGIGIPLKDQKGLFERFHRAQNAQSIQGTGLGLHIVKSYMELLGGTIDFESEENVGSSFYLRVPLAGK